MSAYKIQMLGNYQEESIQQKCPKSLYAHIYIYVTFNVQVLWVHFLQMNIHSSFKKSYLLSGLNKELLLSVFKHFFFMHNNHL